MRRVLIRTVSARATLFALVALALTVVWLAPEPRLADAQFDEQCKATLTGGGGTILRPGQERQLTLTVTNGIPWRVKWITSSGLIFNTSLTGATLRVPYYAMAPPAGPFREGVSVVNVVIDCRQGGDWVQIDRPVFYSNSPIYVPPNDQVVGQLP